MNMCPDTYKEIKTFEYSNCIVRVHIPDLTEQERASRMRMIYKASESLLKKADKIERRKECHEKAK